MAKAMCLNCNTTFDPMLKHCPTCKDKDVRCIKCDAEFNSKELDESIGGCPNCGTESLPCLIAEDIQIEINWHELRILTNWAKGWSKQLSTDAQEALERILDRLEEQAPEGWTPLTIEREVKELQQQGLDIEIVK